MHVYVHRDNLSQKENNKSKYSDGTSCQYIKEIREKYEIWNLENTKLKGPYAKKQESDYEIIKQRVALFNEYKDFVDQKHYAEKFDSRSNLHSSVLEEFVFYLFRDMVLEFSQAALIGKAHAFKDIFFMPSSYTEMVEMPNVMIEKKDHDFVIGVNINVQMNCVGKEKREATVLQIPAIAIECKTYLDKTMLEGSSTAAAQLVNKNPNAIYIVVAEWLKLTAQVNLRKYKVDQIYVLRKQKNTDREFRFAEDYIKNPVQEDVVFHLFEYVRNHLTTDWESGNIKVGLERGYLL